MKRIGLWTISAICTVALGTALADEGEPIYKSQGCISCHKKESASKVNPSLTEISQAYQGKEEQLIRTHLKNVFWPHIFVGASFQILNNQEVACGLTLGPVAILNQNPIFEMGSRYLKGESEAIVRPEKSNLMKRHIEKTKALSDSDRKSLADYILRQH